MSLYSTSLTRRHFLKAGAAACGGIVLGLNVPSLADDQDPETQLLPLVTISPTGRITVASIMSEMGQGVFTSLPQIVAEELDADWAQVVVIEGAADEETFGFQGTYASLSISTAWDTHRTAGAKARQMLLSAAAKRWGISPDECSTRKGYVTNNLNGERLAYGALAADAATLPVPEAATFKSPENYSIVGTSVPRRDTPAKVSGAATFGVDVQLPNMKVATVLKKPFFGAELKSLNQEAALAMSGVQHIFPISSGVAIVADHYWLAQKAAQTVEVDWQRTQSSNLSSNVLKSQLNSNLDVTDIELVNKTAQQLVPDTARTLSSEFEFPLLAHATMEPVNFTAHVTPTSCELWGPTQDRNLVRKLTAQLLELPIESVIVHTTFVGGGFGRKADLDFVQDAIEIAQKVDGPVKVMWSREADIQHCIFRPMSAHRLSADITSEGSISNWTHRVASHGPKDMIWLSTDGAGHIPYDTNGMMAQAHLTDTPIAVGTLRGIAHSSTNFANEVFLDEIAKSVGRDPIDFRISLLDSNPRAQKVLRLLSEKASWKETSDPTLFRGVALFDKPREHTNFYIAQVVDVRRNADGLLAIERVVTVADFGIPINPAGIIAQVESGIAFGLSMALYGQISIENGSVIESNFHDYEVVRMPQIPNMETHVVTNGEFPRGCGEHINPAFLPALANAVSRATGQPVRNLPLDRNLFA